MRLVDFGQCTNEKVGVMAIGYFDSIHIGHRLVISRAVSLARSRGECASVFLFRNNIYSLIGGNKAPLFSFEERVSEIASLGVDEIVYVDADAEFLAQSPAEFLTRLREKTSIITLVCGKDFTFGKGGVGTVDDLMNFFPEVEIVDLRSIDGVKVSTTQVKRCLSEGNVAEAGVLLDRPYVVRGTVASGRGDGKKMGVPTANIPMNAPYLKAGVYYTNTILKGEKYPSITNVGGHPTFPGSGENIETYILDYSGDLYGKEIRVEFLEFVRDIVAFSDEEALCAQIKRDEAGRREYD